MSWKFWANSRAKVTELSPSMKTLLAKGGCDAAQLDKLRYVGKTGKYSDRQVTYVRIFDPGLTVSAATDYDEVAPMMIFDGRLEEDGTPYLKKLRR